MGKVHGSLARAGKVKSQTPKVHLHRTPNISTCEIPAFWPQRSFLKLAANGVRLGRTTREEEDSQRPSKEAHHIYKAFRQRDNDWWKAKGMLWLKPSFQRIVD
jgi:Ribosomal protein S30